MNIPIDISPLLIDPNGHKFKIFLKLKSNYIAFSFSFLSLTLSTYPFAFSQIHGL